MIAFVFRYNHSRGPEDEHILAQFHIEKLDPYISNPAWLLSSENWHFWGGTLSLVSLLWCCAVVCLSVCLSV